MLNGDDAKVDEKAAAEMVGYAMAHGVNYYDTAWGYHNGNSELVMGRALARYPRESYFLADKFPGYDLSNMDKSSWKNAASNTLTFTCSTTSAR